SAGRLSAPRKASRSNLAWMIREVTGLPTRADLPNLPALIQQQQAAIGQVEIRRYRIALDKIRLDARVIAGFGAGRPSDAIPHARLLRPHFAEAPRRQNQSRSRSLAGIY